MKFKEKRQRTLVALLAGTGMERQAPMAWFEGIVYSRACGPKTQNSWQHLTRLAVTSSLLSRLRTRSTASALASRRSSLAPSTWPWKILLV